MSAVLYDTALLNKLKRWTRGSNAFITGVDDTRRLFEVITDSNNDKPIELPLIALNRRGGYIITNKQKQPITFSGRPMATGPDGVATLNVIPIEIQYQLDIYTRYLSECDEYARNFVFNFINYPQLDIVIPYENANLIHHANVRLASDVEDNSDIPQRLIAGQFTRMTLTLSIDDAYLWDVYENDTVHRMADDQKISFCEEVDV